MNCIYCGKEINPKDRFCSKCGNTVENDGQSTTRYEKEIRQLVKKQDDARSMEEDIESLDLSNPTGILKAQLKLLISISKRVDKLEAREFERVRVVDFDMPFWSLVNFELKVILVGLFFMFVFSCLLSLLFSSLLKNAFLPLIQQVFMN